MAITTKRKRVLTATGKVVKNVGFVALSAIATGILTKKSKDAVMEIGDGAKQIYNVVMNTIQKW
jgi:hypothetical protein